MHMLMVNARGSCIDVLVPGELPIARKRELPLAAAGIRLLAMRLSAQPQMAAEDAI
jgi:hypothetical protein